MRNIFITSAMQIVTSESNPQGVYSNVSGYPIKRDSRDYEATAENPNGNEELALIVCLLLLECYDIWVDVVAELVGCAIHLVTLNLWVANHYDGVRLGTLLALLEYEVSLDSLCVTRYAEEVLRYALAEREFVVGMG